MVIDSYDYKLSCPKQMIKFVQENMKDKTVHINWDKFDFDMSIIKDAINRVI